MLQLMRGAAIGLLALAAVAALLIWATMPSAKPGQMFLPPKADFTKGRYAAYVGPWGGEAQALARPWSAIADGMVIDLKRFPSNTRIRWRWPPFGPRNGVGVWGYDWVGYDNFVGTPAEQPVPPTRVRDLKAFRQSFRWSIDTGWGDANVLTEFYLRASPTVEASHVLEVGWFLHAPPSIRGFFENSALVGEYVDPAGRHWTVRLFDQYCMFAPTTPSDVPEGEIDMLHALRWLKQQGRVSGDEWLWGVAIGAEPISGMGDLRIERWNVVRE
jgi:hypothetical protein